MFSDFVTNSYGESCDSMEIIASPNPETSESQLKNKKKSLKLKMLRPLCNQTINLKTDAKTLYYSIQKLKYGPSLLKRN